MTGFLGGGVLSLLNDTRFNTIFVDGEDVSSILYIRDFGDFKEDGSTSPALLLLRSMSGGCACKSCGIVVLDTISTVCNNGTKIPCC